MSVTENDIIDETIYEEIAGVDAQEIYQRLPFAYQTKAIFWCGGDEDKFEEKVIQAYINWRREEMGL